MPGIRRDDGGQSLGYQRAKTPFCRLFVAAFKGTRAVLMTWSDKPDDEGVRVRGSRNHAGRLNAFTIAAADRQWFYLPGTAPPRATGRLLPLSPELVSGYSAAAAERSARRAAVSQEVQGKLGRVLGDRELSVIRLTRGGVQN